MSVAEVLVKQILADAHWLPSPVPACEDDQLPEDLLLPDGVFGDAPGLDVFRHRDPDSIDGEVQPLDQSQALLGTYHHMHSPGVITLYRGNIEAYWRSLLNHAQRQYPFIYTKDAERVLQLVVQSVYQHERFHYVCDFGRRLFNSSFDRWHEEALAVATEWHWLKAEGGNTFVGRMHPTLRRIVVNEMFRHTSRGYRDWRNFASQRHFLEAVRDYVHPTAARVFSGTDFDFGRWVVGHVADDSNKAWVEQIG